MTSLLLRIKRSLLDDIPWWLFWGLFLSATWYYLCRKLVDWDLWWHMAHGRFFLEKGYFPPAGVFTYGITQCAPNEVHGNFSQVLWGDITLYVIYKFIGGYWGLQALRVVMIMTSVLTFFILAGRRRNIFTLTGAVMLVLGTLQIHLVRNAIFCMLFVSLMVLCWSLIRPEGGDKPLSLTRPCRKWLILAYPLIFFLWNEIHGSTQVGTAVLFFILLGEIVDQILGLVRRDILFALAFVLINVAASKLASGWGIDVQGMFKSYMTGHGTELSQPNPGPSGPGASGGAGESPKRPFKDYFRFIFRGGDSEIVAEYQSPFNIAYVISAKALFVYTFVFIIFTIHLLIFDWKEARFSMLFPMLATIPFGLGYLRTICFPFLVGLPFMGHLASRQKWDFRDRISSFARTAAGSVLLICLVFVVVMQFEYFFKKRFQRLTGFIDTETGRGKSEKFRETMPQFVLKNIPPGEKVYNSYNIGGYCIWEWYLDRKVYIDGRSAIYNTAFYEDYKMNGSMPYIQKWDIKWALFSLYVDRDRVAFHMRQNWTPVAFDTSMVLLRRSDTVDAAFGIVPAYVLKEENVKDLDFVDTLGLGIFLRNTVNYLLIFGRVKDAYEFIQKNERIFLYLDPMHQTEINEKKRFVDNMMRTFGSINHLLLGDLCRKLFSEDSNDSKRLFMADVMARLDRPKDSINEYLAYVKDHPDSADAYSRLAAQYFKTGMKTEALQAFVNAINLKPDNFDYVNNAGVLLYAMGRFADAEKLYRRALEISPGSNTAHYNLGVVFQDTGRKEEAIREFEAALKSNPAFSEATTRLNQLRGGGNTASGANVLSGANAMPDKLRGGK